MKTRTVSYKDGRREVIQVLDQGRMSEWTSNDPLAYEASIMWLTDISKLPYVRVLLIRNCENRRGRLVPRGGGKVVGYAKLTENAPVDAATGKFTRRVFYLREEDLEGRGDPAKAINPATILPGITGEPPAGHESASKNMQRVVLPTDAQRTTRKKAEKVDDDVMEWLADAVAPTLSVKGSDSVGGSQSLVDTEIAHDVPDDRIGRGKRRKSYGQLLSTSGASYPLDQMQIRIGRDSECDIVLPQSNVSGCHCELSYERGLWFVEDFASTNGTRVNGLPVPPQQKRPVDPGAILSLAKHDFEVHYEV